MRKRSNILAGIAAAGLLTLTVMGVYEHGAGQWATLKAVEVTPTGNDCRVSLSIAGPCGYQISRSGSRTLMLGLEGARAGNLLQMTRKMANGLFQGYRITSAASADGSPAIQIQFETRSPVGFSIQNQGSGLGLVMKALDVNLDVLPPDSSRSANAVAMLLPMKHFAAPLGISRTRTMLSGILIRRMAPGRTLVSLNTSKSAEFKTLRLNDPPRLVIDLENAGVSTGQEVYTTSSALVKEIRVAEHENNGAKVARVVADLAGNPAVNIHSQANGVQIELTQANSPKLPNHAAGTATPIAKVQSEYEQQTLAALMRPVKVSLEADSQTAKLRQAKPIEQVLKPVPKAMPSVSRRRTRVVASQPRLAQAPLEFADTLPVRPDWKNVDSAPYIDPPSMLPTALAAMKAAQVVVGSGSQAAPPRVKTSPAGKARTSSQYTGELISLNLKDVDLKDFFRLIHEISGLNVILDPNVSGTVTLVLDDVPWDEALDIVLKNNGLGKQLEGNVLRIARIDTLTEEEGNTTKLLEAQQLAAPLIEVYRPLRYASAIDVIPAPVQIQGLAPPQNILGVVSIIKSFARGSMLSMRGSVVADPRNNAVIVTDVPTQIPVIESLIDKLDRKPKQISIEARIVQANADFTRQLSSVLAAAFNNNVTSTAGATGSNLISNAPPAPPVMTIPPPPLLQSSSAVSTGFGSFAITNATARYAISAALSAAETHDQAKVISRPTIVTQNNVLGEVQQGVQVPIQTNINNTISVQYVNATLQLGVIPQVTQGGQIFLNIVVNNASVGAVLSFAGPSINTQQATTQVLVPDGGTVVFGGITVTNRNRSATYVPLLGSIPIIGNLFKSSSVNTQDQELLFFVSPKILPDNS